MSTNSREQSHEVVLALLRAGDARALLAAALIVVTLTLTVHTKARALDETGRAVLYVGAPSVSVSSAREAGAISRSYAETASPETLLALGFSEESASRYVVDRALASVTEQPADPDEIITAQAALEAGAVYLAQTGSRPTGEADPSSEGKLASTGPVRPELGDGTVAPAEDLPADDTSTKDLAVAYDAGDGGDLAHVGRPPDTPVAAYPGTSEDDPAALYLASGGEEPLEFVEEEEELVFEVALGSKADEVRKFRVPLGHGIAGLVAVSGQPMAVSDVAKDPRQAADIAESVGYAPESILCVPLFYEEEIIGVLELLDREGAPSYSAVDMATLGLFANQAAVAIEQSRNQPSLGALLGDATQSLGGVPDHREEALLEGSRSFTAGVEEDASYRRALELAALVREISHQGEEEHRACRTILEGFAGYLRSRPRAEEEVGEGW
jgi:putative methionine-R-sulfoxide reductase with GAF domain